MAIAKIVFIECVFLRCKKLDNLRLYAKRIKLEFWNEFECAFFLPIALLPKTMRSTINMQCCTRSYYVI